jgi:hypothetical protein
LESQSSTGLETTFKRASGASMIGRMAMEHQVRIRGV